MSFSDDEYDVNEDDESFSDYDPNTVEGGSSPDLDETPLKRRSSNRKKTPKKTTVSNPMILDDSEDDNISSIMQQIPAKKTPKKSEPKEEPKPKRGRKRKQSDMSLDKTIEPATKKSKTKTNTKPQKLKGSNATNLIQEYMKKENRPWNLNSIKTNLDNQITLSQLKKSLNELVKKGILTEKTFNKGKVVLYWYNQDKFDETQKNAQGLENELKVKELELKNKTKLKNEKKKLLDELEKKPSDENINRKLAELHECFEIKDKKIQELSLNRELFNKQDINKKFLKFYKYANAWKKRKDCAYEMISEMFGDSSMKPDQIISKTLNCDTDKEAKIDWQEYAQLYKEAAKIHQREQDAKKQKKKKIKK